MPQPIQSVTPQREDELTFLWSKVVNARSVFESQRRMPLGNASWVARVKLLSALEVYAASLTRHRRPIPYALRDELTIRRLTR
jgi:hypothetical protein